MAIQASAAWYIRTGASAGGLNNAGSGGYDSAISGAGTNYADQDAVQVTFSSGNSNRLNAAQNSTTVTSDGTPFTSAMVGNCIKVTGGTNFVAGYYFITGYTSSSQITVDRAPATAGAGSVGVGVLGGALATIDTLATSGGGVTLPTIASPLAAGHTVWIQGSGSNTPSANDYTHTAHASFPSGDTTSGPIMWRGYNGRPQIGCDGLTWYSLTKHSFTNLKLKATSNTNGGFGILHANSTCSVSDCWFDQAGFDVIAIGQAIQVRSCFFENSGTATTGAQPCIQMGNYGGHVYGCFIKSWRYRGVDISNGGNVVGNVIANCKGEGIYVGGGSGILNTVLGNTIYSCTDGVGFVNAAARFETIIGDNIIVGCLYGVNVGGTTAVNDRLMMGHIGVNAFYNNTSGRYNSLTAPASDVILTGDPFTAAASADFSLNATAGAGGACRAAASMGVFPAALTTGYRDIGAVQHQDTGGGGGGTPTYSRGRVVNA